MEKIAKNLQLVLMCIILISTVIAVGIEIKNMFLPAGVRDDVTQIPGVSDCIRRRAVRHLVRVKVRTSGHAPVGRVSEFVHVQTVFARRQTGDVADNRRRARRVILRQS